MVSRSAVVAVPAFTLAQRALALSLAALVVASAMALLKIVANGPAWKFNCVFFNLIFGPSASVHIFPQILTACTQATHREAAKRARISLSNVRWTNKCELFPWEKISKILLVGHVFLYGVTWLLLGCGEQKRFVQVRAFWKDFLYWKVILDRMGIISVVSIVVVSISFCLWVGEGLKKGLRSIVQRTWYQGSNVNQYF